MKNKCFLGGLLLIIIHSCRLDNPPKTGLNKEGVVIEINVPINYDNTIQVDSLFESIDIIPLETTEKSLISNAKKIIIYNDKKIYIQDFINSLYVFDINGKFIQKIRKQGQGPKEYIQLAGFDVDNHGNIYILDYHKILKFDPDGNFEFSKNLNFSTKKFQCWPEQLLVANDGYFIWSGSLGIKENKDNRHFAMYYITNDYKMDKGFFPIKHKLMSSLCRFRRYDNLYNIDPTFGNDTIFSIIEDEVVPRYYINFGKRALKKKIPDEYNSFSEFKSEIAANHSFSPINFTETDDWIYFSFSHNFKYYNAFYSKVKKKTYVSAISPESFPKWIDSSWGNSLIILVDPVNIIGNSNSNWFDSFRIKNNALEEKFKSVSLTDNPVVFVCKMKKFKS